MAFQGDLLCKLVPWGVMGASSACVKHCARISGCRFLVGEVRDVPSLFSAIVALALTAERSRAHGVANEAHAAEGCGSFARSCVLGYVFLYFSELDDQHLLASAFCAFLLTSLIFLPLYWQRHLVRAPGMVELACLILEIV